MDNFYGVTDKIKLDFIDLFIKNRKHLSCIREGQKGESKFMNSVGYQNNYSGFQTLSFGARKLDLAKKAVDATSEEIARAYVALSPKRVAKILNVPSNTPKATLTRQFRELYTSTVSLAKNAGWNQIEAKALLNRKIKTNKLPQGMAEKIAVRRREVIETDLLQAGLTSDAATLRQYARAFLA